MITYIKITDIRVNAQKKEIVRNFQLILFI